MWGRAKNTEAACGGSPGLRDRLGVSAEKAGGETPPRTPKSSSGRTCLINLALLWSQTKQEDGAVIFSAAKERKEMMEGEAAGG